MNPPAGILFNGMDKEKMIITASHGVEGTNAQGFPCIIEHPEAVGEFLFDFKNTKTGDYDVCGMLYGTEAGRKMTRRMLLGDADCLSLSHDTVLFTNPQTGQRSIGFSGNHVAILESAETPPGREGCFIHHMVPLSKKNTIVAQMINDRVRQETGNLDKRIEEFSRKINEYLAKNPPINGESLASVLEPIMSETQDNAAAPPIQPPAQAPPAESPAPEMSLEALKAGHLELQEAINAIKADSSQWFASKEACESALNSSDDATRNMAQKAVADMAMREKNLSEVLAKITAMESQQTIDAMRAQMDQFKAQMAEREAELLKQQEEVRSQSNEVMFGNFQEIMRDCGAEAGLDPERMDLVQRGLNAMTSMKGDAGRDARNAFQVLTTSCSKLSRGVADRASGRFGNPSLASNMSVNGSLSSLFGSSGSSSSTTLPFSGQQVRSAVGNKRQADTMTAPSVQDAAKKQATSGFFTMPAAGSASQIPGRAFESGDTSEAMREFEQSRARKYNAEYAQ